MDPASKIEVFMMDLLATVPYYDAYLCRALEKRGVSVRLGAISYYLDRDCFSRFGLRNSPGLLDVIGNRNLPKFARQPLKLAEMVANTMACRAQFSRSKPDIVHVQFLPLLNRRLSFELRFLRWCQGQGIKVVYTVHDLLPHDTGEGHKATYMRVYQMMDALVCHDEVARDRLVSEFGVGKERIRVIPHGPFFYDFESTTARDTVRRAFKVGPSQPIVLWQGVIRPYKGLDFLLETWASVGRTRPDAVLIIAGTGNPNEVTAIRGKVAELGIGSSVRLDFRFLPLDEMLGLYQAADMVVYPYRAITTSGALMTGLTQGKPIIATDLAGFRSILHDNHNSLLIEYGNVEGFGRRILKLMNEPELSRQLAANARPLNLGDCAWTEIASLTQQCYEEVLGRRDDCRDLNHANALICGKH